ncbi:RES domain-containing protein [uncultured Jatrophihabitans sp.]|uniref:RES domain-containing protein n=1 Tax=uncultured Jatrophihabitans sp. TaxID=1610747 RepID=UPI0035CA7ECD
MADYALYARRPLPETGAWRVHPAPDVLPRLTDDGPGANRYDDPHARYAVRYVAENLTGALVETMARFRRAPAAEALLAAVEGVESDDERHLDPGDGVAGWLAVQNVARVALAAGEPLIDVHDPQLLRDLDKHPLVRDALAESGLGTPLNPPRLDEGIVRLGGPHGRPVTQALSRAAREWLPDIAGLAYRSRLDDDEWCWAIWDTTDVRVDIEPLNPVQRHHRRAVQHAAHLLEIQTPEEWQ